MHRTRAALTLTTLLAGVIAWAPSAVADDEILGAADTLAKVVVKVDVENGHSIEDVAAEFPIAVDSAVLASRGIYLVRSTDARFPVQKTVEFAKDIAHSDAVVYAEPDLVTTLADTRFHAWPNGHPTDAGTDPSVWSAQPAAQRLRLADAHLIDRGDGTTVAVLDTGADAGHPALAGRLAPSWDYVDDDGDPADDATGTDDGTGRVDTAYGHGTFVSGVISMVAPGASIMPMRVLDSNGRGNVFAVSQAILDATAAGADVINLSFGTPKKLQSHLLEEAIKNAKDHGVAVVAAAGNLGTDEKEYPAAQPDVIGVSALSADSMDLTPFSGWGDWVDVAAPGERVAGPVPGGRYAWWDGTSVAAPFVAGQVALLRAAVPTLNEDKVLEAMTRTSDKIGRDRKVHSGAIDVLASLEYAEAHQH